MANTLGYLRQALSRNDDSVKIKYSVISAIILSGLMIRVFLSTVIGVLMGIGIGLGLGWGFPAPYTDSTLSELSPTYQDDYTVLIATGYVSDGDVQGALSRLQRLDVDNVPEYVQSVTERFISNSRPLEEIQLLVALSHGFGRFTPIMESFCQLCRNEAGESGQ